MINSLREMNKNFQRVRKKAEKVFAAYDKGRDGILGNRKGFGKS